MNIKQLLAVSAVVLSSTLAMPTQAQFVGEPLSVSTVTTLEAQAKDDQYVALEGYIVQKVGKEDYLFKDQTGSVRVEIDSKVFAGQLITPQTKVRIEGKVDKEMFKPLEIDVKKLTVIQ